MDKGKEHKPHIGIFGRRNYGKSSLINSLIGQDIAIVSPQPGTTTDPVKKSIEIEGIGPAVIIDTAGIDDTGELGELRVKKAREVMQIIDLALLLITDNTFGQVEEDLFENLNESGVPVIIIHNKSDLAPPNSDFLRKLSEKIKSPVLEFSTINRNFLPGLFTAIKKAMPETAWRKNSMLGDLISHGDIVMLITPVDTEAPEGRLILPQVQAIRDILDNDCIAIVLKEREVDAFMKRTAIKPKLAVCDTSVILKADASIPDSIPLTGFSILLARYKGAFEQYLEGTPAISELKDGDRILMLESCTHHISCDDIGRIKIPRWMSSFTGKNLTFDVVAGLDNVGRPITDYALIIQCGGCMITRKQIVNRLRPAIEAGIPVTNYGMAIAYMQGVYERSISSLIPPSLREGEKS